MDKIVDVNDTRSDTGKRRHFIQRGHQPDSVLPIANSRRNLVRLVPPDDYYVSGVVTTQQERCEREPPVCPTMVQSDKCKRDP